MAQRYDARGNIYIVVAPDELRRQGIDLPDHASDAAQSRETWALAAIEACCGWAPGTQPAGAKEHRSDGLLVGPFQNASPFDLLIVNTDGTFAERSGNGLTIFSQALSDQGLLNEGCELRVHHDKADTPSPGQTSVKAAQVDGVNGFWLDLGRPGFGPTAVSAHGVETVLLNGRELSHVEQLSALNGAWSCSQFARVGNPHCVTLVESADDLPSNEQMREPALGEGLTRIAYAMPVGAGKPCPAGINLQWAMRLSEGHIAARVFERGEGPTASSGTSASAVACAAWRVGWVSAGEIKVTMPGGTAPILLEEERGELSRVSLFGTARMSD
ncbi:MULTISPECIES: DeoR family transcriptional regulator [unclassified Pseudomonas]|jgi:diaminopimelate epimerase|uniref:DeoR family transcriptional regulator n=1 Tax=unclassified Pseudomonas TaxID=196821 RepID=UPI00069ED42A|nr:MULTISPECIES: DeoR family transcriptional regulator [unclassified Pseudomonas]WPN48969.1 diaminopimelate epimerase [Pseudomonas sp. P8_241]